MEAKLNQEIVENVTHEIVDEINSEMNNNNSFQLQIYNKELELSKEMNKDVIGLLNRCELDINKYKNITKLDTDKKIELNRIINNIIKKLEIYKEKNNDNYDDLKRGNLDDLLMLELFLKRLENAIKDKKLISFNEIPIIIDENISKIVDKIKTLNYINSGEIKKIKDYIIFYQKELLDEITNYVYKNLNTCLKNNNIEDKIIAYQNDYKEIYKKFYEIMNKYNSKKSENETLKYLNEDELHIIETYEIDISNISEDIVIKLEAEKKLYYKIINKCLMYNKSIKKRGK